MTFTKKITLAVLMLAALQGATIAGESGTVYSMLSTNGVGLGYAKSIDKDFALRGQINALPKTSYSGNVGDFGSNSSLKVDASWRSVQLLADWYPTASGLRLSAGAMANRNKITIAGAGTINGVAATVNSEIKMCCASLAPYVGIGYSTRPKDASGWGLVIDVGIVRQDPKATLTTTTPGVTAADIAVQKQKIDDAIKRLRNYPVIGIGVSYAF